MTPTEIEPGDRVRIASGTLAGLTGECTQILSDSTYVLKINNWQARVCVVVRTDVVQPLEDDDLTF